MPSEIRHIVFTDAEASRAVRAYRGRTGTPVLSGESTSYTIDRDGPGQELRFSVTVGSGAQSQTLSAAGAELVAALILYCRGQRIPLPATAAKSLLQYGSHLCLVITRTGTGVAMPPLTPATGSPALAS